MTAGLKAWSRAKARYDGIAAALASTAAPDESLLETQLEAESDIERLGGWDCSGRHLTLIQVCRMCRY